MRLRASLGHCDHPNNVRIPDSVMTPTQEPPFGQAMHPLLPVSALSKTQYSLSPQFSGLMPPESEQDEEPSSGWPYPVGHASHERLGLVFWSWKKPAGHSKHVWPVAALNFPLSLLGVIGMGVHEREEGRKKTKR